MLIYTYIYVYIVLHNIKWFYPIANSVNRMWWADTQVPNCLLDTSCGKWHVKGLPNISKTKFLVSPSNLLLWAFLTLISNMAASFLAKNILHSSCFIQAKNILLISHIQYISIYYWLYSKYFQNLTTYFHCPHSNSNYPNSHVDY